MKELNYRKCLISSVSYKVSHGIVQRLREVVSAMFYKNHPGIEVCRLHCESLEKELFERLRIGMYGDIHNYPVKEYEKVLEMDSLQAANEDEEEEPEIEYVEGYDELEEELEYAIEYNGGLAMNRVHAIGDNSKDEDGDGDEDDDAEADQKRGRKESSLALRKVEKTDAGSKPKKRAQVLVEVAHENADARQTAVH